MTKPWQPGPEQSLHPLDPEVARQLDRKTNETKNSQLQKGIEDSAADVRNKANTVFEEAR